MKRRFQKMNRGLLLGAVLLVGFVVFVVVKNAQFQKSVPDIKDLSKEYVEAMMKLNELSSDAITEDYRISSQVAEQKTAEMEKILATYWNAETKQDNLRWKSGADMRKQYQEFLFGKQFALVLDTEVNISDVDIEVKSDGPNRAKVTLYTDDLYVTSLGAEHQCLFIGNSNGVVSQSELEEMYRFEQNPLDDPTCLKSSLHLTVEIELELVGGKWKIISTMSNYWRQSSSIVANEGVTEGGASDE